MKFEYLVICVDEMQNICLVERFDTEDKAVAFMATDAATLYDELKRGANFSIEISQYGAKVTNSVTTYRWSTYPLAAKG